MCGSYRPKTVTTLPRRWLSGRVGLRVGTQVFERSLFLSASQDRGGGGGTSFQYLCDHLPRPTNTQHIEILMRHIDRT